MENKKLCNRKKKEEEEPYSHLFDVWADQERYWSIQLEKEKKEKHYPLSVSMKWLEKSGKGR